MSWMNSYEIEEAENRWRDHATLGPATRTLLNLMRWTDSHSDGWAYWPKPKRAAEKLCEMIGEAQLHYIRGDLNIADVDLSHARLKAALRPIKAFRTREKADFVICETQEEMHTQDTADDDIRRRSHIALAQAIANEYDVTITPEVA